MSNNKSLEQWLSKLESSHNKKIDLGLERVSTVYNSLKLNKIAATIITVAGTNGKGSTVAILSAICRQAGYKVGEFTSPHIQRFNERIKIHSKEVSNEKITTAFAKIEKNLHGISLSYFEYATLAACIIFKRQKVDIAILEVGLGGRLDSVNAIDTDCAIITTIDIDHTAWLGNNKEAIGFEKAGIMRNNKPVIYGDNNCPQSIIKHAQDIGATLIFTQPQARKKYVLNIKGQYQQTNTTTAITAIQQLTHLNITENIIKKALKNIQLQARLEVIASKPDIIIDVSHNQQAALELTNWLKQNPITGKTIAVFAVLADKQVVNWLQYFKDTIDVWNISQVESVRAMPTNELLQILSNSARLIISHKNIKTAIQSAQAIATTEDRIIVFGSFYTVSEVLREGIT
ncbi:MAG: bifunctional folylpolyglutamate synthase/dihydrofolate synthase [Proteobacteria bacterium]|nr:bifunctional folylpolyglutamate synthase/dihydrofolate synthase [Pseudomonadota bacterium]